MDGAQHGASDIVGVNLVARHHQHGGAVFGLLAPLQQPVGA